jgi:hypothetical protein
LVTDVVSLLLDFDLLEVRLNSIRKLYRAKLPSAQSFFLVYLSELSVLCGFAGDICFLISQVANP